MASTRTRTKAKARTPGASIFDKGMLEKKRFFDVFIFELQSFKLANELSEKNSVSLLFSGYNKEDILKIKSRIKKFSPAELSEASKMNGEMLDAYIEKKYQAEQVAIAAKQASTTAGTVVPKSQNKEEPGFFAKLFGSQDAKAAPEQVKPRETYTPGLWDKTLNVFDSSHIKEKQKESNEKAKEEILSRNEQRKLDKQLKSKH
jgi:hypothetical protein